MTSKTIRTHIQNLKGLRERNRNKVNKTTLGRMNSIIDLFEERKIPQFTTAERIIKGLISNTDKGKKEYTKALQK